MYTSIEFWKHIDTPFAITLQSDTLICHHVRNLDLKATYIGGISPFNTTWSGRMMTKYTTKEFISINVNNNPEVNVTIRHHLNDGFSIRNVAWVHDCITKYGSFKQINDDDLMNYCRENLQSSKKVLEKEAFAFSSDNGHSMCHDTPDGGGRVCPLGVHQPWHLKRSFSGYSELVFNCTGLEKLKKIHETQNKLENVFKTTSNYNYCGKTIEFRDIVSQLPPP